MHIFESIISTLLTASLVLSPAFAQTTSSSISTTTQSTSSGNGGTTALGVGLAVGAGVLGLSLLSSAATGISFGGKVISVVPCGGGMLHVTVLAARGVPHPEFYIWTPATITKLAGPPTHIGQQILGKADVPFVCFIGGGFFFSPIPLYGLRMQLVGTSAF